MADIQVYQRVIDYVGLNAKPIPERSLALFRELQPVLALLQGMGSDGAKLVSVDANGNLRITTQGGGAVSKVSLQNAAGTQDVVVVAPGDAVGGNIGLEVEAFQALFDNAAWVRSRSASAANLALQSGLGVGLNAPPGQWTVPSAPAAGVVASATKAAGGGAARHICTSISFMASSIAAPVLTSLAVVLRDGISGAGTILASFNVAILAAAGNNVGPFSLSGLNIVGSANTAMTLEFSALLANLSESVLLAGYTAS